VSSTEQRLGVLERKVESLRREVRQATELLGTLASPPWRRLLWFLQGYRLWRVGRWYGKTDDLK
jgi:hypothetical protein